MKDLNIAVVGATGMVGTKCLQVLTERNLPVDNYYLFASSRSAGKKVNFLGQEHTIIELNKENIISRKIDYALFSAGGSTSKKFAPIFAESGCVVIDNSSQWRTDPNVPLIVPEVNASQSLNHNGIIANPNCSTIQAVVALKPLHDKYRIRRIVFSTYQAVSGAGLSGYNDLKYGLDEGYQLTKFKYPIAGNVIPHIDVFLDNGYTKEEQKMIDETKKILDDYTIKITATTVRVPVMHGHSESINIEFAKPCTLDGIRECLSNQQGIIVQDDPQKDLYPMPIYVEDKDGVYVGRIRIDDTVESGCNIWVVADNIRKGAATNAVQILEYLITDNKNN